jgi:hypothetical protein
MPLESLPTVYHALVVNRIAYCLSAWGGFLSVEDENCINAFFQCAKQYGFTDTVYNVAGLREHSDRTLFKSLQLEGHCLASILPPVQSNIGELTNCDHIFTLPKCSTVAYKISYLLDVCSILFNCCKFCVYAYYTCHYFER